jgi:transposase
MFPHMDNRQDLRLKVAQYYLNNGSSFRQTALKFQIAYRTVFKWVKLYREYGEERLLSTYKRPWNRANPDIEEKIVLMKEHEPGLTVRKAKERLEKQGIRISLKGIWGVWKRYGYAGFRQKNKTSDFNFTDCSWTKEAIKKYESAKRLFDRGSVNRAAELLNSIPALPENELLPQIPDALLNIRRQIEKIELLFGKMPVGSYLKRLRILSEKCYRRNLYYSALNVGLVETVALSWDRGPLKMLEKAGELENMLKKNGDYYSYLLFTPRFLLLLSKGIAYTRLLKIKKASEIARTCRKLLKRRKYVAPLFMLHLGQLYFQLGNFREAEYWYSKTLNKLSGDKKKKIISLLATIFVVKGEYKKAFNIWKDEQLNYWGSRSQRLRIQSNWSLVKGMPDKAISLAVEALALLKKKELKMDMFGCYLIIASAYCSLGEKLRARRTLEKILPFSVENRLEKIRTIIKILLSQTPYDKDSMSLYEQSLPIIKLALYLRNGQYVRALKYAKKKGIAGFLHKYIFFFPDTVTDLLGKGKPTGLPRAMLKLPVFRKEIPVYSVKFLGNLIVYKNQKYLKVHSVRKKTQVTSSDKFSSEAGISQASRVGRKSSNGVKLTPKDTAFLIHLATAKSRHISLDRVYNNFWPDSKNPARNLAHLLVRIKRELCLPSHFLYIKENRLYFDCHFITDYGEYLEHLAQARAFSVAGEGAFARIEYLHAFRLFRAAPFKKMYDPWSEQMRLVTLNKLEAEALHFAKSCFEHGNRNDARRVLAKVLKIIPNSEEIKKMSDSLIVL